MMRKKESLLVLIVCVAAMAIAPNVFGATLNVPGSYPSFFNAISAANPGDTVLAAPGTYTETDIDFDGKGITVACDGSPGDCTIDCGPGSGTYGFVFTNGEGSNSVLRGFSIRHFDDAGILCNSGSSPTISDCIMEYSLGSIAGGIESYDSSPTMSGCTIRYNSSSMAGGGYFSGGSPTISDCVISDNDGDDVGGMFFDDSSPTINGCTFTLNEGTDTTTPVVGGILSQGGSPTISDSTITYNEGFTTGGIHCQASVASPNITNSTISNNTGNRGGIGFVDTSGTISDCTVVNNTGDG